MTARRRAILRHGRFEFIPGTPDPRLLEVRGTDEVYCKHAGFNERPKVPHFPLQVRQHIVEFREGVMIPTPPKATPFGYWFDLAVAFFSLQEPRRWNLQRSFLLRAPG